MQHMYVHVADMLDENEAILEVVNEDVSLLTLCYPYPPHLSSSDIILSSFLTNNIVQEQTFHLPIKTDGVFSYRITAKVLNTALRIVCVKDIKIILDIPLPKDILDGTFISFDTVRLDWN